MSKSYTYCATCAELRVRVRARDGSPAVLRPCACERDAPTVVPTEYAEDDGAAVPRSSK